MTVTSIAPKGHDPFAGIALLDQYAGGAVLDAEPGRVEPLATISAGTRVFKGADDKIGLPQRSKAGEIYVHDEGRPAPGLRAALKARGETSLTIAFAHEDPRLFLHQSFLKWSTSELLAYGDGESVRELVKGPTPSWREHPAGSADYKRVVAECKACWNLYFALADWTEDGKPQIVFPDGFAPYRLRSTSRHGIRAIRGMLTDLARYTGGRIAGIPLDLSLVRKNVSGPDGKKRTIWSWTLTFRPPKTIKLTPLAFRELATLGLEQGQMLSLPAPAYETLADIEGGIIEGQIVDEDAASEQDVARLGAGGRCDATAFNRHWHASVAGTDLEQDDRRHAFVAVHTDGRYTSLAQFLADATDAEASKLIENALTYADGWKRLNAPREAVVLNEHEEASAREAMFGPEVRSERDAALARWDIETRRATALHVAHKMLAANAPLERIEKWTDALRARCDQSAQEQGERDVEGALGLREDEGGHDETSVSEHQEEYTFEGDGEPLSEEDEAF